MSLNSIQMEPTRIHKAISGAQLTYALAYTMLVHAIKITNLSS